jgi:hypothetical protein
MNANELADLLEVDSWYKLITREEIATMLRQQQAKIEALKKEAALQRLSDFTQEAEHEPVAWMFQGAFDISTYVSFEKPNPDIYPNPTPLYTHPVKELTDEEIYELFESSYFKVNVENSDLSFPRLDPIYFARAILRKAQEK